MWADNETTEDYLGFKVHADLLIDVIQDEKVLPVTIGVFGDWGSGKSSILKIIHEELKGVTDDDLKDDTLVLYFNGWVFEGYDDAKAALLESIIEKFKKHKTLGNKVKDSTSKLLKSVNWMRILGLGFKKVILPTAAAYFTGGLSLIPFLAQEFSQIDKKELVDKLSGDKAEEFLKEIIKKKEDDPSTLVREFREDFKEMIDKSKIKKLVVIIDDLDRCTHERIIENLEAIKLFLNVEKTAFIIGADPRIVRHAIEHRYRTEQRGNGIDPENKNKRIVNDYLEKLIQVPYILPRLSDHEVETYMTLLFCKKELKESYPIVLKAFADFRQKNRYGVFGFADLQTHITADENANLKKSITLIASLSSIIAQGLNGNPRQIKRFLNTFTLRNRLAEKAILSNFQVDILAKLMVLEYSFPELFAELFRWQQLQNGEPKEIGELESLAFNDKISELSEAYNVFWKDPQVVTWLKLEPKLAGIDLSDYFWIARDNISSLSGSSLIPSHIRSLFKSLVEFGSASILRNTVTNDILTLPSQQLLQIYALLEKEITKTPEKNELHKVFYELMAQKVPNSIVAYKKAVGQIADHNSIQFSLRNDIELAIKSNPEVEEIRKIFHSSSQIHKALNPKK